MSWHITEYRDGFDGSNYSYATHTATLEDDRGRKVVALAKVHYWSGRVFDFSELQRITYSPRAPHGCRIELDQLVINKIKEEHHEELEVDMKGWDRYKGTPKKAPRKKK